MSLGQLRNSYQYHIYVREKVERGLQEVKEGRVLNQEEVERRMSKWLGG